MFDLHWVSKALLLVFNLINASLYIFFLISSRGAPHGLQGNPKDKYISAKVRLAVLILSRGYEKFQGLHTKTSGSREKTAIIREIT